MIWPRILKHLLPSGKAWRLSLGKSLTSFCTGVVEGLAPAIKLFFDQVWQDIFPSTTRTLNEWETQWGLTPSDLTEQERRSRLDAAWKTLGGQSPRYIQDTLQAHGFNVFVHEWWTPGTEAAIGAQGCATPRSPLLYLRREFTSASSGVECGETLALCGESFAEAGNGTEPRGYPLVNKISQTVPDILPLCGEVEAACGEAFAEAGNFEDYVTEQRNYIVPSDTAKWPYFLYVGDADINDIAQVPANRKEEFESLCLRICPAQQWLGILVEYT